VVEKTNLTVNVSLLRKILGEGPGGKPYIDTVSRRGRCPHFPRARRSSRRCRHYPRRRSAVRSANDSNNLVNEGLNAYAL